MPMPDLFRGGNRFSEKIKIVRQQGNHPATFELTFFAGY